MNCWEFALQQRSTETKLATVGEFASVCAILRKSKVQFALIRPMTIQILNTNLSLFWATNVYSYIAFKQLCSMKYITQEIGRF